MKRALPLLVVVLASQAARAYTRTPWDKDTKAGCLFWPERELTFFVHRDCAPGVDRQSCFRAVDAAFAAWTAPLGTDLSFVDEGQTANTGADEHQNLVIWRTQDCAVAAPADAPCRAKDATCADLFNCWDETIHPVSTDPGSAIAVTTVTFVPGTGQIVRAEIDLYAAPPFLPSQQPFTFTVAESPRCGESVAPPDCVSTDIQSTLTHEIGHFIGLGHNEQDPNTIMFPSANMGKIKRTLSPDDVKGVTDIYPRGEPVKTCVGGAISFAPAAESDGCACRNTSGAGAWIIVLALGAMRRRQPRSPRLLATGGLRGRARSVGVAASRAALRLIVPVIPIVGGDFEAGLPVRDRAIRGFVAVAI